MTYTKVTSDLGRTFPAAYHQLLLVTRWIYVDNGECSPPERSVCHLQLWFELHRQAKHEVITNDITAYP